MRRLLEALVWWAACTGLWLLTLSSIATAEVVTAMACAVPCAVLAVLARHAVEGGWHVRPGWVRWLVPLPVAVVGDSVRVLGLAAGVLVGRRIPTGEVRVVRLPRDDDDRRWQARQAAAIGMVTATPGTLAVDLDPDSGELTLHTLGAGRPSIERQVAR